MTDNAKVYNAAINRSACCAALAVKPSFFNIFFVALISIFMVLALFAACNLNPGTGAENPGEWIKTFGIMEEDSGADAVVDAFGNVYVVGTYTAMANLGFEDAPYYLTADDDDPQVTRGKNYIFLVKYSPSGQVLWSKNIKTNNTSTNLRTMALKLALDFDYPVPSIYITGFFSGTINFDPDGSDWIKARSPRDVFISKYHAQDGSYLWTRTLGGNTPNRFVSRPTDIKASRGSVYVTGLFHEGIYLNTDYFNAEETPDSDTWNYWPYVHNNSPEIKFTFGGIEYTYQNTDNTFVVRLDANGDYVWGKGMPVFAGGLAIDAARGVLYLTGGFLGTIDIDPGPGTRAEYDSSRFWLTANTDEVLEFFVTALNLNDGTHAGWAEAYGKEAGAIGGGETDDIGVEMAIDRDGNIYLIGMMRRRPRHWHLATIKINGPGHTNPYTTAWEKYNTDFWWDYLQGTDYRLQRDWTPKLVIREPYIYIAGDYSDPFDTSRGPGADQRVRGFRAEYGWGPPGDDNDYRDLRSPTDTDNDLRPAGERDVFITRRHIEQGTYMGTMVTGGERVDTLRGFDVTWGRNDDQPYFVVTGTFRDTFTQFYGGVEDTRLSRGKTDGYILRTRADFPEKVPQYNPDLTKVTDDDGNQETRLQIDEPPNSD